jgi:ribosome-associated toxin RatA of RatAB toxin-antitoxin module
MASLRIDRSADAAVSASPERCLAVLADVEGYPSWSSLIKRAEVLERRADGSPARVRLRAEVLALPVEMDCSLELAAGSAVMTRVPYDAEDDERYVATWSVEPGEEGSRVRLHVEAVLDAPAPARLLGGRIARTLADDVLADFARAMS